LHIHGTSQEAQRCSRFCVANTEARTYYRRHLHSRDIAPVSLCEACGDDAKRIEDKRREQEYQAKAAKACSASGENPAHTNCHLRLGMVRVPGQCQT